MKKLLLLFSALLLIACASENEQKALDAIAENFNAKTSYTKSFNTTNGNNFSSFNIKISESEILDSIKPVVTSGAIALMGYKGFTAEEKEKYDEVVIEIVTKKIDTATFRFSKNILQKLEKKEAQYVRFSEAIINGDKNTLEDLSDSTIFQKGHADGIINSIKSIEQTLGSLKGYIATGIGQTKYNMGTLITFRGLLLFNKGAVFFTCNFDSKPDKNNIVGYIIDPQF